MSMTFENAPLVELVAELKWELDGEFTQFPFTGMATDPQSIRKASPELFSDFFRKFGELALAAEFSGMERLVAEGNPLFAGQPVLRFRPIDTQQRNHAYQVGTGFFSAATVPPYQDWQSYRTRLKDGVEIVLNSRPFSDKDKPFNSLSLRYVNAFGPAVTLGRDAATFIEGALGFKVTTPESVARLVAERQKPQPSFKLQIPMKDGLTMHLAVGEGIANGAMALVMDMSIVSTGPTAPNTDAVMMAFDTVQATLHETFLDIVRPFITLLNPSEHEPEIPAAVSSLHAHA